MTCEKLYLDSSTNLPSKHFTVKEKHHVLILLMLPKAPLFLLETLGWTRTGDTWIRNPLLYFRLDFSPCHSGVT